MLNPQHHPDEEAPCERPVVSPQVRRAALRALPFGLLAWGFLGLLISWAVHLLR